MAAALDVRARVRRPPRVVLHDLRGKGRPGLGRTHLTGLVSRDKRSTGVGLDDGGESFRLLDILRPACTKADEQCILHAMPQSKPIADDEVPVAHRPLVDQLATLHAADRERIVRAARKASRERRHTVSWTHLRDARGIAHIGGDAVKDTQALYDG